LINKLSIVFHKKLCLIKKLVGT